MSNQSSVVYNVVVKEEAPFVVTDIKDGGKVSYSGWAIDVLDAISKDMGFGYKIRVADHDYYNYRDMHGKWNGLVSELGGRTPADIAVGPIPITSATEPHSSDFFAMTKPFINSGVKLLIKNPPELKRGIAVMLDPFAAEVWVMVVLAFIVVSLALFLIGRFSPFEWARVVKEKDLRNARKSFDLKNSFLFTASTFGWQGYREAPRSISGRILMCMWLMFAVMIVVAYSSNLCAIFITRGETKPRRHVPFSSYMDIVSERQIKIGGVRHSSIYPLLQSSKSDKFSDLFTYIDGNREWIRTMTEGIDRVSDSAGRYVFLMDTVKGDYVTATNCDVMMFGDNIINFGYGFAVRSNISPGNVKLRKDLNEGLLLLIEKGFLHELQKKYIYDNRKCGESQTLLTTGKQVERVTSLDMTDMAIPFLFLFLGLLGAGIALGVEIYYKIKFMGKKNRDDKAREPLNTDAGTSKAPRESPPPPPIYKVNNKLQEQSKEKKDNEGVSPTKEGDSGKGNSFEMAVVDETKGGITADDSGMTEVDIEDKEIKETDNEVTSSA